MIALLLIQVNISVLLNDLYGEYGDLLQKAIERGGEGLKDFWKLTFRWLYLVLIYVLLAAVTNFLARFYSFYWRKALTYDYIPRLRSSAEKIEGESQRVQEDTKEFADIVESLGLQAVRNVMILIAFFPRLWELSSAVNSGVINYLVSNPVFSLLGGLVWFGISVAVILILSSAKKINVRGLGVMKLVMIGIGLVSFHSVVIHMLPPLVWIVLYTSLGGTAISWLVGIKLPGLEYNNQKTEAALRKELVLAEDDRARHNSPEASFELFRDVEKNYKRLFLHYGYFDLWSSWWDLAVAFLPSVLIAPSLFSGTITLGTLNKVENVFYKVHNGFAFLMNNWTRITKLRSIWKRLHEFESSLKKSEATT